MSASPYRVALLAAIVFALSPCSSKAQRAPGAPGELFSDNYDFQLFEPFDLDLDNVPVRNRSGYTFRVDKLYWAPTTERTTIGAPGATMPSEIFIPQTQEGANFGFLPFEGTPPPQILVNNSILDAPPQSEFGFGERYEFGYTDSRGISWQVGILDGPTSTSEQVFGFASPNGFGSVFVNFESSAIDATTGLPVPITDLLQGFRDFGNGTGTGGLGIPTTNGPAGTGDGIIDNLDGDATGDGNPFPGSGGVDIDADGNADFFVTDFDDLNTFNIRFITLSVRSVTETNGIELMKTFQLDNRNRFRRHQNQRLEIGYGVRLLRIKDDFFFGGDVDAFGDPVPVTGNTFADLDTDNQIIGPQIRANWTQHRGKVSFNFDGRFLAGLNIQDTGLVGTFAGAGLPGGLNEQATTAPTTTVIGAAHENFSPVVELRANVSYQLSRSFALRVGYTGTFIDNLSRSSQLVGYTFPSFTLLPGGDESFFYHGVSFGVEGRF